MAPPLAYDPHYIGGIAHPEERREEMTDKELLESAAKAAGFKWRWFGADMCTERNAESGLHMPWNPLKDDGDAFRLAAKLQINISHEECGCCVWATPNPDSMGDESECVIERMHPPGAQPESIQSRESAMRRAIVQAAAAIRSQNENQKCQPVAFPETPSLPGLSAYDRDRLGIGPDGKQGFE
jgi:hypothetical protein